MSAPRIAFIVSHTHWDREWYRPFQAFRVELTRVVRAVLDALERDDDFEHFLLDGQAIVVEDHLELHPEDGERIRRLVSSGALAMRSAQACMMSRSTCVYSTSSWPMAVR